MCGGSQIALTMATKREGAISRKARMTETMPQMPKADWLMAAGYLIRYSARGRSSAGIVT